MSSIFLIFNRNCLSIKRKTIEHISNSLNCHAINGSDLLYKEEFAFGIHYFNTTPQEINEKQPIKVDDNTYLLFNGRLDNRDELFEKLELKENQSISDAKLTSLLYKKLGNDSFKILLGSYCFIICDTKNKTVKAARDHLGDRKLCYYCDKNLLIISTEEQAILKHPGVTKNVEEQRLVEYFSASERIDNKTYYKNIFEIYPATFIEIDNDNFRTNKYWDLSNEKKLRYKNLDQYFEHFAEVFTDSVKARLRTNYDPSVLLSGGVDSTSITSVCLKLLGKIGKAEKLKTYSYYSKNEQSKNDLDHIKLVNQEFGLDNKTLDTDKLLPFDNFSDDIFSENFPQLPIYFGQLNKVYSEMFNDKRRSALSGQVADQMFIGGNLWLRDLIVDLKFKTVLSEINKHINKYGLSWFYKSSALRALFSFLKPARNLFYDPNSASNKIEWVNEFSLSILNSNESWTHNHAKHHRNEQLLHGLGLSTTLDCADYAVNIAGGPMDFRYPFRDRRVVSFLLNIPAYLIYSSDKSAKNKFILKESLKNIIPEETYNRKDFGAYNQLIIDGYNKNKNRIFEYLDTKSNYKKFINMKWFEKKKNSKENDDWYMFIVWQCVCYEKWLEKINLNS